MTEDLVHSPGETLPPIADLMAIAEVNPETIAEAVEQWKENPPDPKFLLILEAEPDGA